MIQEPTPYVPEPSLLFPYDNLDSEFIFQVMESFQEPCDNSPLQNGTSHELVNPFGASYDTLRGLDEYQISKIALKIHDLMLDLDVYLDQWNGTYPRLTIGDTEIIRLTIFRAHAERARLVDIGEWRRNLTMLGISDAPAATRIVSFSDAGWTNTRVNGNLQMNQEDASGNHKAPSPHVLIFMRPKEMMPGREHIADAMRNRDMLETYKPLDDEPAYSFLDPKQSQIAEVFKNPWIPVINHIRIIRLFIHRLLGLLTKQFLTAQWRRAVDRLSPEDEARHFTTTMTYSDTFHPESPLTFKASTTDVSTSIPCLVPYRCPYLPVTPSSQPSRTNLFTTRLLSLNSRDEASLPTSLALPASPNPSSLQRFVHSLLMAMLSPSSTMTAKGGNVPSVVISWIYATTLRKFKRVLHITSFPAKTLLTFILDSEYISSCNYLNSPHSMYHFNTLPFIYTHSDSFNFDFCSRYKTLQNILVSLVTYKLLAMKYALIPHLSPPVPHLSYAMLSSTSSVVCSKVFVPSPSVFTPSPIKSHFVGYLQLMKGENKLEKFSEASRRQIPKPRQCLKRRQEVIELADEDFQMRDRLDDNENWVYTLSNYPFEDDDTIIVPAEDMEQVRVDILREQVHAFTMYKRVDQKIKPVSTMFPEEARVHRTIPRDPLLSLVPLPIRPPDFIPMARLTEERMRELNVNQDGFLWPEEEKLFKHVLALNEATLPYDEKDRGTFSQEYFSDYIMPVVSHTPWGI